MEALVVGLFQGLIAAIYFFLCGRIAKMGENRKIGYGASLLLSIALTPIIGFIIVSCIPEKSEDEQD